MTSKKVIIMYTSKADGNDKVQHYAVTKDTKGKLELRKCKSNDIIREYHRTKNDSKPEDKQITRHSQGFR